MGDISPTLTFLVLIYLFLIGYLGYRGWRGSRTATDYLLAGRSVHPFIMALSYGATFISTSAIIGFGGVAAMFGMGLLWLTFLNIFVGVFIAFVFFGARTRAMGRHLDAHTFPELLGRRFDSKFIQCFAGAVILCFMPLYASAVLISASNLIQVQLGVGYDQALLFFTVIVALYVIMGGLKGVMYTDALQGGVMFVGMILLLCITYYKLGGPIDAHRQLTDLAPTAKELFGGLGHQGWTAMPSFGSRAWWILVSAIVLGVGVGVLAQPQLTVRFMTVKSQRELNRAVLVGGIFILTVTGVAYIVGALSNLFFLNDPEVGEVAFVALDKNVGEIIPQFMKSYMPPWLSDVFFISLLAAAMSTVSSQFHAMGTAAGRDVFETVTGSNDEKRSIVATRVGIIATLLFSVFLAFIMPAKFEGTGMAIIARATAVFFGLCGASFLPVYIGALYSRSITKAGAISGMLTGFFASGFWLAFIKIKESQALTVCMKLTGKDSLLEGVTSGFVIWEEVDPICVALPAAAVATVLVSLFTKKLNERHVENCFSRLK